MGSQKQETFKKPVITNYLDYRDFLKDHYLWRKKSDSKFSFRYFSKTTNLKSFTYLKYVIDKKRHISYKFIGAISKGLKLLPKEERYFKLLWRYGIEIEPEIKRKRYLDLIRQQRKSNLYFLEESKLEYISSWLQMALREYFVIDSQTKDYKTLAKIFSQSPNKIKKSVRSMLGLGLITETEVGFIPVNSTIKIDDDLGNALVTKTHQSLIKEAQKRVSYFNTSERELGFVIAAASNDEILSLKNKIREFLIDFNDCAESHLNKNTVYQLSIQLVPLSREIKREKK